MKKQFFTLLLILIIVAFIPFSVHAENEERECLSSEWIDEDLGGYTVYEGKMYYEYCVVKDADINSFKEINIEGDIYARDRNHLYLMGKTLEGISPYNYKSKKFIYDEVIVGEDVYDAYYVVVYDEDTAWLRSMDISDADIETLSVIDEGYLKDKNYVYEFKDGVYNEQSDTYEEDYIEIFQEADPDYFSFGYNVTNDAVYWYGEKIEESDAESFEIFHQGYAKDKDNVYFKGKMQHGADVNSFTEFGGDFIDKNAEHYEDKIFKDIKAYKQQYIDNNKSPKIVDQSIKSALLDYEEKYPNYTPQPAIDPDNPPKHPTLDKLKDRITDYKYLNPVLYYSIFITPVVLVFGAVGYVVWRMRKPKGKKRK